MDDDNDYYNLINYNCTHFATNIWNSIYNIKVSNELGLPSSVKSSIQSKSTHINHTFSSSFDHVGYFYSGVFMHISNPV